MMPIRKSIVGFFAFVALSFFFTTRAFSHCQMPCGIYDDELRFTMIEEDITTVEKSMNEITKLSSEKDKNYNQIVRWVENKENHAAKIMDVVTQYFMTQRLKPVSEKDTEAHSEYLYKLSLLHEMLFYAMKAKQTTDLKNVKMLRTTLERFRTAYFGH